MRFLADESCDFSVVRALRAAGHDVVAVAEVALSADDSVVSDLAVRQRRILLTEDKDLGQLVFAQAQPSGGVLFIRYPAAARRTLPKVILDLVAEVGSDLSGCFVVVQPGRIRMVRRPSR
jgi:predicted nuclease of predicted toxin-antitoxin system